MIPDPLVVRKMGYGQALSTVEADPIGKRLLGSFASFGERAMSRLTFTAAVGCASLGTRSHVFGYLCLM